MRVKKLAQLMAVISCGYLTQCTMPQNLQQANKDDSVALVKSPSGFQYPKTRTHQEHLDEFLLGEYGMPPNVANINNAIYDIERMDDGIDHYSSATIVDKYRWLEAYDPIDPNYAYETSQDRQRNMLGTRFEDGNLAQKRTQQALQQVDANAPSSEVNDWVNAQNKISTDYIKQAPFYEQLSKNADSLLDVEKTFKTIKNKKIGEIRNYRHKDGYRRLERTTLDGRKIELVNERNLSEDGSAIMRGAHLSKDGSYLAFFVLTGSADADSNFLHIIDTTTGALVTPIIAKIPRQDRAVVWLDDDSLLYNAYDNSWITQVYRRDIGKERFVDPIEVASSHIHYSNVQALSLEGEGDDKRYLTIKAWKVADTVYIKDLHTNNIYRLHNQRYYDRTFANSDAFNNEILAQLVHFDPKSKDVYLISGENNPKGEIIKTNLNNLNQRTVVVGAPKDYDITRDAYYHEEGTGYFVISYLKDGVSRVLLADATTGKLIKDITPPQGAGFASELSGHVVDDDKDKKKDEDEDKPIGIDFQENFVSFRYTNPTLPETDFRYSIAKDKFIDIRRHDLSPFDADAYETKLVFYTSYDGTKVPMNISYKKGIKLDGKNPTLLYGYGGYGVIYDQSFGFPADTIWLENGGVWAHAFIRGGGEYGKAWQEAAQHVNRLKGYDDFAAAADYLAKEGWASPEYLGIIGGSNGGLLVGAAMVRHPAKYRVAIPEVAVLDMLRHEKMGITSYWMQEYGTPEESRLIYHTLMSYSPQHNIRAGVCYPSTLVKTSKRDDRVVPSHSYKYAAILQEHQSCKRPVLLHAAEKQGHSPNTHHERKAGDLLVNAFAFKEMGITQVPVIERPSIESLKTDKQKHEETLEEQRRQEKIKEYQKQQQN